MERFTRIALALFVALFTASCGQKPDAKTAAQQFFDQVAKGNAQQAHSGAAFAFQAEQNARVFEQAAKEQGLIGARDVAVEPLEEDGKTAKFNVLITTPSGERRTFIATLQQESGKWKMFSLTTPRSLETGLRENHFSLVGKGADFSDALNQPMPDEKTIKRLVAETIRSFNDAIQRKSFAAFYQSVANKWRSPEEKWRAPLTEGQLQRAFQPFVDQGVNMGGALGMEPVLDPPPQITTEGLLQVTGYYPTKPYQVVFSLKYTYELPNWKLFGIDVNLRKSPE